MARASNSKWQYHDEGTWEAIALTVVLFFNERTDAMALV